MKNFVALQFLLLFAVCAKAQVVTNEYNTYDEDKKCLYRHVVNYNAAKERASETIYMKQKNDDGTWSTEKMVDRGVYTYEYDAMGRLAMKQLRYEKDELESYRIYVTYNDGETIYKQYTIDEDNNTRFERIWGAYADGNQSLATISRVDHHADCYLRYDHDGNVIERGRFYGEDGDDDFMLPRYRYDGFGLESTVTRIDGDWGETKYYRYNDKAMLVEYAEIEDGDDDGEREVYTYDDLGRILTSTRYSLTSNNDGDNETQPLYAKHFAGNRLDDIIGDSYTWTVREKYEFTYANDEVYGLTNSWYNGFGFCGPVASYKYADYDYDGDEREKGTMTFTRDASGKLLAIDVDADEDTQTKVTVDDKGHITKVDSYSEWYREYDDNGNELPEPVLDGYSSSTISYTWDGENLIKVDFNEEYYNSWLEQPEHYSNSYSYTYGDGMIQMKDPYNTTTLEDDGTRVRITYHGSYDNDYVVVEKQTEDVKFAFTNPFVETKELALDSIKVVSRKGRVVQASTQSDDYDEVFLTASDNSNGYRVRTNIDANDYYHVKMYSGKAYCYDIKDNLRFVVEGEKLLKEYIYTDEVYSVVVGGGDSPRGARKVLGTTPEGACTIREYHYDNHGNLIGVTTSEQDENGNITVDYAIEYVYDEASGIDGVNVAQGFVLNGRSLGIDGNQHFSLYDINGRTIATAVTTYTFNASGIYLMKIGGKTVKIQVK